MSLRFAVAALGLLILSMTAQAADTITTLDVHHAGCVLCAPIIKATLAHVKGVKAVQVSQAKGMADVTATVTYDPAETTPAALIEAVTNRGYPADLVKKARRNS